jgi:hypothetical protein
MRGCGGDSRIAVSAAQGITIMNLTDTQRLLLSAASQRDDLLVPLSDRLKGGAARSVAERLLALGLAEECTIERSAPFWREEEGEPIALRVTPAGLAAIGLDDGAGAPFGLSIDGTEGLQTAAQDAAEAALAAEPASAFQQTNEAPSTLWQQAGAADRHALSR